MCTGLISQSCGSSTMPKNTQLRGMNFNNIDTELGFPCISWAQYGLGNGLYNKNKITASKKQVCEWKRLVDKRKNRQVRADRKATATHNNTHSLQWWAEKHLKTTQHRLEKQKIPLGFISVSGRRIETGKTSPGLLLGTGVCEKSCTLAVFWKQ